MNGMAEGKMEYTTEGIPARPEKMPEELADEQKRLTDIERMASLHRLGEESAIKQLLAVDSTAHITEQEAQRTEYFRKHIAGISEKRIAIQKNQDTTNDPVPSSKPGLLKVFLNRLGITR